MRLFDGLRIMRLAKRLRPISENDLLAEMAGRNTGKSDQREQALDELLAMMAEAPGILSILERHGYSGAGAAKGKLAEIFRALEVEGAGLSQAEMSVVYGQSRARACPFPYIPAAALYNVTLLDKLLAAEARGMSPAARANAALDYCVGLPRSDF